MLAEACFNPGADGAHVSTAGRLAFDLAHDLAHVANTFGAGRANSLFDQGIEFVVPKLLGQVGVTALDLCFLDIGQVLPTALFELFNGIAALLDHFVQH